MNKHFAYIISDSVYMIKENNVILNVHYHCSTLNTKCTKRKNYTPEFRILLSAPSVQLMYETSSSRSMFRAVSWSNDKVDSSTSLSCNSGEGM
jgi:hypothetical protein